MRFLTVLTKSSKWQVIDTKDNCKVVGEGELCQEMQSLRDRLNREYE